MITILMLRTLKLGIRMLEPIVPMVSGSTTTIALVTRLRLHLRLPPLRDLGDLPPLEAASHLSSTLHHTLLSFSHRQPTPRSLQPSLFLLSMSRPGNLRVPRLVMVTAMDVVPWTARSLVAMANVVYLVVTEVVVSHGVEVAVVWITADLAVVLVSLDLHKYVSSRENSC